MGNIQHCYSLLWDSGSISLDTLALSLALAVFTSSLRNMKVTNKLVSCLRHFAMPCASGRSGISPETRHSNNFEFVPEGMNDTGQFPGFLTDSRTFIFMICV